MKDMVLKWIPEKHKYVKYELPEGASLWEEDMEEVVSCASCGKKVKFGNSYTSRHIHEESGFGFAVCKECYEKELKNG